MDNVHIDDVLERWKKIFLVAGNQGRYIYRPARKTIPEIKERIKHISFRTFGSEIFGKRSLPKTSFPNVYFLDDQSMEVDGLYIYGTTLWSEVENKRFIEDGMNDYRRINIKENHYTKNISPSDMLDMCESRTEDFRIRVCVEKLKQAISTCPLPMVVISHYLPSYSCIDEKYKHHACNSVLARKNQEHLLQQPIVLWLFGHSKIGMRCIPI